MAYILQIDTSGSPGLIAVSQDGIPLSVSASEAARDHASLIHKQIREVLDAAGITFRELDAVAVCAGPGSYTGLRIGLSVAKGVCYALDLPLLMDNKLTLLAHQETIRTGKSYDFYAVILKAREREVFLACYDRDVRPLVAPVHVEEDQMGERLQPFLNSLSLFTDSVNLAAYLLQNNNISLGDSKLEIMPWAAYIFKNFKNNLFANITQAEPFYLKEVYISK